MKMTLPLYSPADSGGTGQGLKELDQAIAVLGQLNILIPVGYALGKSIVSLVKGGLGGADPATIAQAQAAVAGFEAASADVRQTAEAWLETHPRT